MADSGYLMMDFGKTIASADDLVAITNRVEAITNSLEARAQSSLHLWEGGTRTEYWAAKGRWDAECQKMRDALKAGGVTLTDIVDTTKGTENKNTALWGTRGNTTH